MHTNRKNTKKNSILYRIFKSNENSKESDNSKKSNVEPSRITQLKRGYPVLYSFLSEENKNLILEMTDEEYAHLMREMSDLKHVENMKSSSSGSDQAMLSG